MAGKKKDPRLERAGVSGYNKPKRTPNHKTKSHVVVAKEGDQIKTIRFGEQGAKTNQNAAQRKSIQGSPRQEHRQGKDVGSLLGQQGQVERMSNERGIVVTIDTNIETLRSMLKAADTALKVARGVTLLSRRS